MSGIERLHQPLPGRRFNTRLMVVVQKGLHDVQHSPVNSARTIENFF
jgi:hypothetical protein